MNDDLFERVQVIAQDLVKDLQRGELQTEYWRDESGSYDVVTAAMDKCLEQLATLEVAGERNRIASNELWRIAGKWLEVGTLQTHGRVKPRGYAGDFEILDRICLHYRCEHPLGRLWDRLFQENHAPCAVRNRTELVAAAIVESCRRMSKKPLRLVSVGSGPALDVFWALERLSADERKRLHVTLVDIDPEALDYAGSRLKSLINDNQLKCARENLYRFARRPKTAAVLDNADLISCTGLFDYLNDDDAAAMLAAFWQRLSAEGRLMVFNFAPHNPSRVYMEWIGNWYLTYRDREQMEQLAERAGIPPAAFTIGAESLGVDLFIDARRRVPS